MTDPNYTHLLLIVDRSGSMTAIQKDMNGGIRTLLREQAKLPGKLLVGAFTFDAVIDAVGLHLAPTDRALRNLVQPRGATALFDAVGTAVVTMGEQFARAPEDERPGKVIAVIVTDGQENSSREWTADRVKTLVDQQQDTYKWEFIFLGANIDSFAVGGAIGTRAANTMDWTPSSAGVANAFASTNSYLEASRSGGSYAFTEKDRAAAMEDSK